MAKVQSGEIRVGIGGWDYDPWRGTFYPPGLPRTRQLEYASRQLTAIEINATFYKLQTPALFERWGKMVPAGFKFALKGSRFCVNRRELAEAGESVARFCAQGITALGDKLGPINWQMTATKRFEPDDFAAFLKLLPKSQDGVALRHAIEPRHESFRDPAFVAMARKAEVGIVFADDDDIPGVADASADFRYARLRRCREGEPTGYPSGELDGLSRTALAWSNGEQDGLPGWPPLLAKPQPPKARDTFLFFIAGAKVRAPAAALALIARLGEAKA